MSSPEPQKILVVSCKPLQLSQILEALNQPEIDLILASDPCQALDICREQLPDLLLIEIDLPSMTGVELCRLLKSDPDLYHIPVIFIDDKNDPEVRLQCYDSGGVDVIVIPFFSRELKARVTSHLSTKSLRIRLEDELKSREAMIWELDAFGRRLAHNLKNPLHGLILDTQLLRKKIDKGLEPSDLQQSLKNIEHVAWQCNNIIQDLWMLSVVKKTRVELHPVDMRRVIHRAIQRYSQEILEKEAVIRIEDYWPNCLGVEGWCEEIWANLISNALKYGGEKPNIIIGFEGPDTSGSLRLFCRDNGPGFPPQMLEQGLEEKQSISSHHQGLGLGLSIILQAVKKMHGKTELSNHNGGAEISFTLHISKEQEQVPLTFTSP